ncbi:MAG: CDP-alcohol phosphatidyltransferase family protein [Candidatus Omnitrophica bacterium]|nr:CDP-alcohol phosphatidyltransferase family protein [Candidatus Omnitrophota bacterium]
MTRKEYSLSDVEKTLQLKTWWAAFAILPFAKRTALYIANRTNITPDQMTLAAFVLRITVGLLFLNGSYQALIIGAVLFEFAYMLDCVDGSIARLKGKGTERGRYLDHLSDIIGGSFCILALCLGSAAIESTALCIGLIFLYASEYGVTYFLNNIIKTQKKEAKEQSKPGIIIKSFMSYRDFFFKKNFKSFISLPDFEAITFFIFPLLNKAGEGLKVGFVLLVIVVLYKVVSGMVSISSYEEKFP